MLHEVITPQPDLVFLDIHLADGASFLIFNQVKVCCPVIFTTAYDKYALDAFKVNSIDYLLKPIEPSNVIRALDKLKQLTKTDWSHTSEKIIRLLKDNHKYARTLLVEFRDKLTPVAVGDIAYFYTKDDVTLLCRITSYNVCYTKLLRPWKWKGCAAGCRPTRPTGSGRTT